jgi:hypothetical protein
MLEVPLIWIYNNSMMNEIVKGDIISDGFEEGMVIGEEYDKGDKWWLVWDGKEAWKMHSHPKLTTTYHPYHIPHQ